LRLEGLLGCRELAGIDAAVAVAEAAGAGAGEAAGENWVADPRSAFPFAGDEASGLARLRQYCLESDGLRHYKQRRNGLVGTEFSSKFSPYLGIGSLSVRRIWQTVLDYQARCGADEGSEWMKQELLWREFFLWTAQRHGASFGALGGLQNRRSEAIEDRELFERWCRGRSGHPLIDAQLNELRSTGYLSNRGRQWVASHFINELRLPWTWGARFFEWWLIDAQPALNTGNWAYLAGVGNDPRSFNGPPRRFDLERQVRLYDPEEMHRRRWA
jgi:deoxyribodipyrimidine photo-lyase